MNLNFKSCTSNFHITGEYNNLIICSDIFDTNAKYRMRRGFRRVKNTEQGSFEISANCETYFNFVIISGFVAYR